MTAREPAAAAEFGGRPPPVTVVSFITQIRARWSALDAEQTP